MPTIKDIAKRAGVSQGTVSNVLNGKEHVRSDKIKKVLQASQELGYTINERAKWLRAGTSNLIAVLIPSFDDRATREFFFSFEKECSASGFMVRPYLTEGNEEKEKAIISSLKGDMVFAVAAISSISGSTNPFLLEGFLREDVLFIGSKPSYDCLSLSIDCEKTARDLSSRIKESGYEKIASFSMENNGSLISALKSQLDKEITITEVTTNSRIRYRNAIALFEGGTKPDCIITDCLFLADTVRELKTSLFPTLKTGILSLSPYLPFGTDGIMTYQADFHLMGKIAAEMLTGKREKESLTLSPLGFSDSQSIPSSKKNGRTLKIATLASPTVKALSCLKNRYLEETGIDVTFKTYSYEELYALLQAPNPTLDADIIRLDSNLLSWFGTKVFTPLDTIDSGIKDKLTGYINCLDRYAMVEGHVYSLPGTPNAKLLFYRKDIFTNFEIKRSFQEKYKRELLPPATFEEYNRIAEFLTVSKNPDSPTRYGSTLTVATPDVAGIEYLLRYFSLTEHLFGTDGNVFPDKAIAAKAFEDLLATKQFAPESPKSWWADSVNDFIRGDAAMTIQYSSHVAAFANPSCSIIDRVGWAPVPGGRTIQGGSAMGVYKNSSQREEALRFMLWVNEDRNATACTLLGGLSPKVATYKNQEVIETYPWLVMATESLDSAVVNLKPPHSEVYNEQEIINTLGRATIGVLDGKLSIDQAIDYIFYSQQIGNGKGAFFQ